MIESSKLSDLKIKFTRQGNVKMTCESTDLNLMYCFIC